MYFLYFFYECRLSKNVKKNESIHEHVHLHQYKKLFKKNGILMYLFCIHFKVKTKYRVINKCPHSVY